MKKDRCRVAGWDHLRQSYQTATGGWRNVWQFSVSELRALAEEIETTDPNEAEEADEIRRFAAKRRAFQDVRSALTPK